MRPVLPARRDSAQRLATKWARAASTPALGTLLVFMMTACDGSKSAGDAAGNKAAKASDASGCAPKIGVNPGALAVSDYIKTADPKPMRFLTAAGTDSAISDEGMPSLQDKGPTYFYAGKETQKAKVRAKLEEAGPFTALLVVMRADRKNADGTRTITLGGHFVTGQYDGKETPVSTYTFSCDSSGWKQASKQVGSGS
jgi:hypothetical protein